MTLQLVMADLLVPCEYFLSTGGTNVGWHYISGSIGWQGSLKPKMHLRAKLIATI